MEKTTNILIISSTPETRARVTQMLSEDSGKKCDFKEATLGAEGLEIFREKGAQELDCVVLDERLPDMDAIAFLDALGNGSKSPVCPVVVITAPANHNGADLLRAGAQDTIGDEWMTADSLGRSIRNAIERFALNGSNGHPESPVSEVGVDKSLLKGVLDNLFAFVGVLSPEGVLLEANEAPLAAAGISEDDVIGKSFWDCYWWSFSPESQAELQKDIARAREGETLRRDCQARIEGGQLIWIDFQLSPMRDDTGRITHLIPSGMDITERKQAEAELRKKKDELAAFFEDATIGLHWVGSDGIIQWANPAELEMLGYAKEEYIGHHIADFHADQDVIEDILDRLTQGEILHEYEARLRHKDGSIRYVQINSSVYKEDEEEEGFQHTQCFTTDITERRNAVNALRESEQKVRAIFDGTDEYIGLMTPDGTLIEANQASLDFDESAPEDVLGKPYWETVWFEFTPGAAEKVKAAVKKASAGEFVRFEADLCSRDGSVRTYDLSLAPILSDEGEVIYIVPEGQDITGRKQAERALGESARRMHEIIDALPAAIYTTDAEGHVTHYNSAAVHLSGREPELGTDQWCVTWKLYHPDGKPMPHHDCPMARALKSGVATTGNEAIAERPDGSRVWFAAYPTPLRDAAGKVNGGVNMLVDITARKRSEEARRESEERFRGTFESAGIGMANIGPDERWLRVNQAFCEMIGYSREELLELTYSDITHPDDIGSTLDLHRSVREGEVPKRAVEKRYIRKDGSTVWANLTVSMLRDKSGEPIHAIATIEDISEKKEAVLELEQQRRFVERLTSVMPSVLYVFDIVDLRSTWVNRQIAEALGYSPEEIPEMGSDVLETLMHPDDLPRMQEHFQELAASPDATIVSVEYRVRHRRGDWRWFQSHATPFTRDKDGEVIEIIGTASDITTQMKGQDVIRKSEERMALGVQVAGLALSEIDYEAGMFQLTPEAARMFGLGDTEMEVPRDTVHDIFHPDDQALLIRKIEECLEPESSGWFAEDLRIVVNGGQTRWLRLRKQVFFENEDGGRRPVRAAMAALDVTAEKDAAAAIVASEERFRKLFEHAATGIAIADSEGRLARCNPAYCKLLGYTQEELKEIVFSELVHPEDRAENLASIRKILEQSLPHFEIENRYIRKDGESVWVRKFVSRMREESNEVGHLVALVTDVTEQRRIQAELREAAKRKDEFLAMLGHELRNPLAAIRHAVQVSGETPDGSEDHEWAREVIDRQSQQLSRMVDDLLDVARITRGRIELRPETLALADVLKQAVAVVRPKIEKERQRLTCDIPDVPLCVRGDAARLEQIFGNLLNNAAKYTPEGGNIDLAAKREGDEVVVTIRDDGAGISPDLLPQLFDLFRQAETTLDRAQGGLGIGLTVVKSLIELHDGSVAVESEGEGRGSTFIVRLPLQPEATEQSQSSTEIAPGNPADPESQNQARKVLVVDDHEDAARGLARLLERRGYEVRVSHDGKDALVVAGEFCPEICLLDLGLPGLDGYEVARLLRADARFVSAFLVAISGYAQQSDLDRSKAAGFDHHFAKPIKIASLFEVIGGCGRNGEPV